jgi:hypothetical protein
MNQAQELVLETAKSCDMLSELLKVENEAIRNRELDVVAENIKIKDKLSANIVGLLARIKEARKAIGETGGVKLELDQLQQSFDTYQKLARKNALLLKSAHESTAIFLDTIREIVEAHKPKSETYGKDGSMAAKQEENAAIVRKSV